MIALWLIAGVVFAIFWIYQFIQLMLLSDTDFPGRYDKALWTAAFLLAVFLAPFAVLGWKYARKTMVAGPTGLPEQKP